MGALLSADDVATALDRGEVRVLDVQYALTGTPGRELYAAAHVPGAPFLDLDAALAGPPGPRGRHPLPDPRVLEDALRRCGISDEDEVVVYDQRTSLSAARAWWVLRWAGHPQVRVLDGGLDGLAARRPPGDRRRPQPRSRARSACDPARSRSSTPRAPRRWPARASSSTSARPSGTGARPSPSTARPATSPAR